MSIPPWIDTHRDEFAAWFTAQRWYGDKSRVVAGYSAREIGTWQVEGIGLSLLVLRVSFTAGASAEYFIPMIQSSTDAPADATTEPALLRWFASGFSEERNLAATNGGAIVWSLGDRSNGWSANEPRVLGGEQSNTSVIYGTTAILKLFRKYQSGTNPDSEIVAFLTAQGAFPHVPAYLGSILHRPDDESGEVEIATVQSFVPNQGDCWRWLVPLLAESDDLQRRKLIDDIGLLGQRTGELHVSLASGIGEAFAPEVFDNIELDALVERLAGEIRQTATMLFQRGALSHGDEERLVSGLMAGVAGTNALAGSMRMRVHGDYHLGQVLKSGDDFTIIDFEGEPSRPMDERRQKHSPFKDVAGMVRSVDYAVSAAGQLAGPERVSGLRLWGEGAARAFVEAYRHAAAKAPTPFVPPDRDTFDAGLDIFMTEKALYEVRYELDNRPDWLDIPLTALRVIAAKD